MSDTNIGHRSAPDAPERFVDRTKATMSIGAPGSIISTQRLSTDLTLDERARPIADRFGSEAAAIVVALSRELLCSLDRALELCRDGSPEFRAACECNLIAVRAQAAAERTTRARKESASGFAQQENALVHAISCAEQALKWRRNERDLISAGGVLTDEQRADLDAAVNAAEQQLERARDHHARWLVASDADKSTVFATPEVEPAKKSTKKGK